MSTGKPLRVAVVTPYYRESIDVLRQCHHSVLEQTYPCTHFMVADGEPVEEVSQWSVQHTILPRAHADAGDTPRGIGSLLAMSQGFDAIAFLDADNWYYPSHIATMVALHRDSGALVCTASRTIHRKDGSIMYRDRRESDGARHVDTSCFFLTRLAFGVLPVWTMMPKELAAACDRVFWHSVLAKGFSRAHCVEPTVAFRTQYEVHYMACGERPPPGVKTCDGHIGVALRWWLSRTPAERRELEERYGFRFREEAFLGKAPAQTARRVASTAPAGLDHSPGH